MYLYLYCHSTYIYRSVYSSILLFFNRVDNSLILLLALGLKRFQSVSIGLGMRLLAGAVKQDQWLPPRTAAVKRFLFRIGNTAPLPCIVPSTLTRAAQVQVHISQR